MVPWTNQNKLIMKRIQYATSGTCSKYILIDIDSENVIQGCAFVGGCMGNTSGVCSLIRGMKAEDVIARLKGIDCAGRGTSCPDQLARALEGYLAENK